MGRPRHLPAGFMEEDFRKLYKQAKSFDKPRYLGLHHIQEGRTYSEVSKLMLVSELTVKEWVKKYKQGGVDKLRNQPGRGRKGRLKISDEAFRESILQLQQERAGGRVKAKEILHMLKEKFQVIYSLSGLYKVLERRRIVWITGRSIHPKADVEAQESFKKIQRKS